jgi:DNA transformation protein
VKRKPNEDNGLVPHILDLLADWPVDLKAKRMFGGIGMFADGVIFGIIVDDVLYFKDTVDAEGKPLVMPFKKEYCQYERNGEAVTLGYFKAPDRAMEQGSYAIELASQSLASGVKAKSGRGTKKGKQRS